MTQRLFPNARGRRRRRWWGGLGRGDRRRRRRQRKQAKYSSVPRSRVSPIIDRTIVYS